MAKGRLSLSGRREQTPLRTSALSASLRFNHSSTVSRYSSLSWGCELLTRASPAPKDLGRSLARSPFLRGLGGRPEKRQPKTRGRSMGPHGTTS